MTWVVFGMICVVTAGKFTDFALGRKGRDHIRDMIVDLYISISEGNWFSIFQIVGKRYLSFIEYVFGARGGIRYYFSIVLYSLITSGLFFWLVALTSFTERGLLYDLYVWKNFFAVIATNFVFDTISIFVLHYMLQKFSTASSSVIALSFIAGSLLTYIVLVTSEIIVQPAFQIFGFPISNVGQAISEWAGLSMGNSINAIANPFSSGLGFGRADYASFSFPVILPLASYVLYVVTASLIYISKPMTKKPLIALLERLDEQPDGFFLILASTIAVVAGLLQAFLNARKR